MSVKISEKVFALLSRERSGLQLIVETRPLLTAGQRGEYMRVKKVGELLSASKKHSGIFFHRV